MPMSIALLLVAAALAPFSELGGAPQPVAVPSGFPAPPSPSSLAGLASSAGGGGSLVPVDPLDVAGGGLAEGAQAVDDWTIRVAGGEYEPAACAVISDGPVRIEWTAPEGGMLLDVRACRSMPLFDPDFKVASWNQTALCRLSPGDEVPSGTIVWLTVWCPPGTPRGERRIRLTARCDASEAAAELRVVSRGFDLDPPSRTYFFYYLVDTRWVGFYPGNWKKHLSDMRAHGLNAFSVYERPKLIRGEGGLRPTSKEPAPNSAQSLEEAASAAAEYGFDRPLPFIGGDTLRQWDVPAALRSDGGEGPAEGTPAFDELYLAAIGEALSAAEGAGVTLALSTVDEAGGHPERLASSRKYLELFKKTFPGALTYQTLNGRWYRSREETVLDPWLDIRCYNWLDKETIGDTRRAGDQLWLYNGGSGGTGYGEAELYAPSLDRFFFGFYAVAVGADGVGQWAYQYPRRLDVAPSQEVVRGAGTGYYYTYPSATGPVPTVCWEMVREGIDDARYVDTLRRLSAAAPEGVRQEALQRLERAVAWVPLGHQTPPRAPRREAICCDRKALTATRERIAAAVEWLLGAAVSE